MQVLATVLLGALSAQALVLPLPGFLHTRGHSSCPAVWKTISEDLTRSFLTDGQCNDKARAAIRYAFHDAGTFSYSLPRVAPASGGADGSLLLNPSEIQRSENAGLRPFHAWFSQKWEQYKGDGISAADFIQFAGNHATVTCPGGPTIRTVVGREDSWEASPEGLLPVGFGPGSDHDTIFNLFKDKGFNAGDLAAFIGAHSTSKNIAQTEIPVGVPQDTTPGVWDVKYYAETYDAPQGIARFESDINLSNTSTTVGKEFATFVGNQLGWNQRYADAMFRLSVLGVPDETSNEFVDCTWVLPAETPLSQDQGRGYGGRPGTGPGF